MEREGKGVGQEEGMGDMPELGLSVLVLDSTNLNFDFKLFIIKTVSHFSVRILGVG